MALVLGRRDGEVVYAELKNGDTITLTLLSHHYTGSDKVALIKAEQEDGSDKEYELSHKQGNVVEVNKDPYVGISLKDATKVSASLTFHGSRDEVTFLRKEVKERNNG